jgi:hypothetical protein
VPSVSYLFYICADLFAEIKVLQTVRIIHGFSTQKRFHGNIYLRDIGIVVFSALLVLGSKVVLLQVLNPDCGLSVEVNAEWPVRRRNSCP